MTQMSFDFQSFVHSFINNEKELGSQFVNVKLFKLSKVHDPVSDSEVTAYKYSYQHDDYPIIVNLFLIKNETFVPQSSAYFNTISCNTVLSDFDQNPHKSIDLNINVYVNNSHLTIIKDLHPNLKTIITSYFINKNGVMRKAPQGSDSLTQWLHYDPSVGMFVIASSFVFIEEVDYSNIPSCYYRTSSDSTVLSNDYKYANRPNLNICSNEIVEKASQGMSAVCQCPFNTNSQILSCPYYKEDKIKISTVELVNKARIDLSTNQAYTPDKVITAYIVRLIDNDTYSVLISEKNKDSELETTLKKFVYTSVNFNDNESKDKVIEEIKNTISTIISDYSFDYAHKIIYHINSVGQLRSNTETTTRKSYLVSISQ